MNLSAIELCKKALSIDSSIVNGTSEYTEYICGLAETIGMICQTKNYLFRDLDFQNILITQKKDTKDLKYLFVNPLDTEAPGPFRAWTATDQDPFDIKVKDGKMYGLGANSGKLSTVLLLKALSETTEDQKSKFALLGTYGREVRSHGALRFLKEKNVEAMNAIIGFPTSNRIIKAQPGRIRMRINFPFTDFEKKMKSEHDDQEHSSSESQYFHSKQNEDQKATSFNSNNAIVQALKFIENLPDQLLVMDFAGGKDLYSDPRSCLFEFDLVSHNEIKMGIKLKGFLQFLKKLTNEFQNFLNEDFLPECPFIHLGRVVCDLESIEFWGECVFPPGIPESISDQWILSLREEINKIGGSSKLLSQRWPYIFKGDQNFLNQITEIINLKNDKKNINSLAYTSEADLFKISGFQPLIFGPGDFAQMFKPNEYIQLKSIEESMNLYRQLVGSLV